MIELFKKKCWCSWLWKWLHATLKGMKTHQKYGAVNSRILKLCRRAGGIGNA